MTNDDIVLARVRTSGVAYTTFEVGSSTYSIADVGGQRSGKSTKLVLVLFIDCICGWFEI